MIKKGKAFEQAIANFPRQMDIRKRGLRSNGGKFLKALIDEVESVDQSLESYRKEFFAKNYIGKEDTILDYVSNAYIGDVDATKLTVVEPSLKVTTDIEEFIQFEDATAYYEDGHLLIKLSDRKEVQYKLEDMHFSAELQKMHLWNVFDEFALYNGLERHEGESNKALLDRCFASYKNKTNSTKEGIQNVIINELKGLEELLPADILIEPINDESIHKKDINGKSVSDLIVFQDADVYRGKVWDANKWTHSFKELEHASVKWDEPIENKRIGTGHNSLGTHLSNDFKNNEATDIGIHIYKESPAKIEQFLKTNRQDYEIELSLQKHKDELTAFDANYKVVGEELVDLTFEHILFEGFEKLAGESKVPVSDIAVDRSDKEYTIIPGGTVSPGQYSITFSPKDSHAKFDIREAKVVTDGGEMNILRERAGYEMNGQSLSSTAVKFHGDRTEEFYSTRNVQNKQGSMMIRDTAEVAELTVDVSNIENQYVRASVTPVLSDITVNENYVTKDRFVFDNGEWVSRENGGEMRIKGRFTEILIQMTKGSATMTTTIDGVSTFDMINGNTLIDHSFDEPKEVEIVIQRINNTPDLGIKSVRYALYEMSYELSKGDLIRTPQGVAIPRLDGNRYLIVKVRNYTGLSPKIDYVYIGSVLDGQVYTTDVFNLSAGDRIIVDSTCNVTLNNLTEGTNIYDFTSIDTYVNNTQEDVYIQIDTSYFTELESSVPEIKPIVFKGRSEYYIVLEPGQQIQEIQFKGTLLRVARRKTLRELVNHSSGERIYSSRHLRSIIIKDDMSEREVVLDQDTFGAFDLYRVSHTIPNVNTVYVTDSENNKEVISNEGTNFEMMYFAKKDYVQHISYYRERIAGQETRNIPFVNNFYPALKSGSTYHYWIEVDRNSRGLDVMFESMKNWTMNTERTVIQLNEDVLLNQFLKESIHLKESFRLSDSIQVDETLGGKELAQYMITLPKGMSLSYSVDSSYEVFYARSDRFNKLKYVNLIDVTLIDASTGDTIPTREYSFTSKEGILYWNSDAYAGKEIHAFYQFSRPSYINVEELSILYKAVSYHVDAYDFIGSTHYYGIKEDTMLTPLDRDALAAGDHFIVQSSHPLIRASIRQNSIMLDKSLLVMADNNLLVEPGYYYAEQKEWYKHANPTEKLVENNDIVHIEEGERLNDEIILSESASNYLKGTNMRGTNLRKVCDLDLTTTAVKNKNSISKITASDSYHLWTLFENNMSYAPGLNGDGIKFSPYTKNGWALLDLTHDDFKGKAFSAFLSPSIEAYLVEQVTTGQFKSLFGEKLTPLKRVDNIAYCELNGPSQILLKGEGVVDDIIISDLADVTKIHERNIERLGFVIDEGETRERSILLFDDTFARYNKTEIDEGYIRTSNTIDWGTTKLFDYKEAFADATYTGVQLVKGEYLQTGNAAGIVYLPSSYVREHLNIRKLYVKVNNVLLNEMRDFRVTVQTSSAPNAGFTTIAVKENTNLVEISGGKINAYIRIIVDMGTNKIIENIEVFADYANITNSLSLQTNTRGDFITKVFDTGEAKKWKVTAIDTEGSTITSSKFYIRGLRANERDLVKTNWKEIVIENGQVVNEAVLDDYEFVQFKVEINSPSDRIKIDHFELGVEV